MARGCLNDTDKRASDVMVKSMGQIVVSLTSDAVFEADGTPKCGKRNVLAVTKTPFGYMPTLHTRAASKYGLAHPVSYLRK